MSARQQSATIAVFDFRYSISHLPTVSACQPFVRPGRLDAKGYPGLRKEKMKIGQILHLENRDAGFVQFQFSLPCSAIIARIVMAISIGTQLGSHEITALLGKGGMGEVYRARDTKLKRDVAIKILPDEFARDADRVSRFQREAELLASLNHPNIAGIYDLEEAHGSRFVVVELVEGDTLADILSKRGALPVDEALHIAKQICEALEAAHEKGIIHRDLKPANIKVMADGKVKVLDFGLAKAMEPNATNAALSNSPTLSLAATNAGVILGTAPYMSPEQAKGRTVDKRTDIFAFGAVLFEMLAGRPALDGQDVSEILARIVMAEPDWSRLPGSVSPRIRELLRRC